MVYSGVPNGIGTIPGEPVERDYASYVASAR